MIPDLSYLVASEVVDMTTVYATSDDKVGIMAIIGFEWVYVWYILSYDPYKTIDWKL